MIYTFSWVCAITGILGLGDWLFARSFLKFNPDSTAAQSISEPWVLWLSLALMLLGIVFALLSRLERSD